MRKALLALVLVASAVALASAGGHEELIGTTATTITRNSGAAAIEIQNNGPSPIYCTLGASSTPVVGKGRMIPASGGAWAVHYGGTIKCICATLQVTTAATWVTELQ